LLSFRNINDFFYPKEVKDLFEVLILKDLQYNFVDNDGDSR